MTENDIEAIEKRVKVATPAPWKFKRTGDWELIMTAAAGGSVQMCDAQYYPWTPDRLEDWEFMAEARQDVPALIQAWREQQVEIKRLQGLIS